MPPEERTKLLIVDDLPENLRALHALIRHDDREIHEARSGEEALTLMLEHEFALAILDVQMPGMDGFELAELMRGTEKTRHIPIVFVSAAGRELNYAFKGYESGAVDFLYKPLDYYAVQSKVNVFVDLYQQRNEIRRQVTALEKSRQEQEILMRELHVTQKRLQNAVHMRDEFMSVVAHELRTPLNTLFLETQMRKMQLERGDIATFNTERLEKMVARDGRQIQSMIRLIDDMLDVSRMRSGKLSIRPTETELSGLLARIVGDLTAQAASAGTTITLNAYEHVHGLWDEFRIEQVIVNLLTNAIRYGQKKPIEINLVKTANSARFYVKDRGPGISPADQARIFEPFERGAGNSVSAGLGLGLYISRQLVEAHNGAIAVQSNPDNGTVFTVTLPLSPEHHQAPEA
ncbi:hybrid sensor histidine kinase/response regulator [Oxalicibacterium solurbis]|uniref:histidine kinase n=1 Tax=Oxalicibacterium solurbis TaxID=69280 RepID=A0A8J3AU70_9BURK|nr:hybrid sensor histidine kinase/response regulator [Oxalicibacterium solurbis]GGI53724.1 hybrid sensor histidine kinase/response regulator [Oxalicibacterium solurbis]